MATSRVKLARTALPAISPTYWALLNDEPLPENFNRWEVFSGVAALWPQFRDDVLANWVSTRPGTRPSHWWAYDATEPRQRLGGVGTPVFEALAYAPSYKLGIPEGYGDDFDASDPPQFESEAAYLRRLKLFAPGEQKRLKKADFEPETVPIPDNLEIDNVDEVIQGV